MENVENPVVRRCSAIIGLVEPGSDDTPGGGSSCGKKDGEGRDGHLAAWNYLSIAPQFRP